jgi:TonB family protein
MAMIHPNAAATTLTAREDQRFFARDNRARFWSQSRFIAILILVLVAHAALLAYFLYRDSTATMQTAQIEETPVEVVVEPPTPPEPPKPPPQQQKKPPPPKPKEEIEKPAFSAPRAPNEEKVQTNKTDQKTQAPKAATPPQEGQQAPPQQASLPKDESKPESKDDAAAKPEEDKPNAEALDKAKPKVAPKPATKQAKPSPKTKKTLDALASLSGESTLPNYTFAKPTPKAPVYGGTEDVRYLAIVQGMIMNKVKQLPRLNHYQEGGQVAVYFHIDAGGRVIAQEILKKSGSPEIDRLAMDAVRQAAPFPPPPAAVPHGLVWGSSVDGQLPLRGMR